MFVVNYIFMFSRLKYIFFNENRSDKICVAKLRSILV